AEDLARFRFQKLRVIRQKLLRYAENLTRRREKPGVSGNSAHKISIAVMHLAPDLPSAECVRSPAFRRLFQISKFNTRLLFVFVSFFARGYAGFQFRRRS